MPGESALPPAREVIDAVARALIQVQGVDAVVLGGSRATGTATDSSDIDIGIYYTEPLDVVGFQRCATALDDEHRPDCATGVGDWGPWINGGGWLRVRGWAVDLLLRDMAKVARCVDECRAGHITIDYQCGHPFGFVNAMYMGEARLCQPLIERTGALAAIRNGLSVYPEGYRRAAVDKFLWECDFSLSCGRKAIPRRDVLYASGSLFRAAMALAHALYAHNRMYCINEKGCIARLASSGAALPEGFEQAINRAMALNSERLSEAFDDVQRLSADVRRMCAQG